LAPLLDALEEQVVLMRLMGSLSRSADAIGVNGVGVAIGSETHTQGLLNASVVTSGYGSTTAKSESDRRTPNSEADAGGQPPEISEGTTPLAFVGSIGPTHMNYPTTISAVKAVAEYLSAFINRQDS
jgi:heat-inducible transcriptional repressor